MWVLVAQVIAVCTDLFNRHSPSLLDLFPVGEAVGLGAPLGDLPLEFLETHGRDLGLALVLVAPGIEVLFVSIVSLPLMLPLRLARWQSLLGEPVG